MWDVSNVERMSEMFEGATSFNQPLNKWNVSNVKIMYRVCFRGTSKYSKNEISNLTSQLG